jgi:cytosine deaminase
VSPYAALSRPIEKLARARVPAALLPDGGSPDLVEVDLSIANGRIAALAPSRREPADGAVDLAGRMVLPGFVDMHTHLDKGHIWPRAANPDGSFRAALEAAHEDRVARWTAEDLRTRMDFALRCAWAHGTVAIRTHLDSIPPQERTTWPVFAALREAWAGRIELQGVGLALMEHYRGPDGETLARHVVEHGGLLGGFPLMGPELDADLDRLFMLAARFDVGIDLHVDESDDPEARVLAHVAAAARRHGYAGRVVCGHCCSLAVQPEADALRTLDEVARAGIAIVGLPMCNAYLLDRLAGRTPRWRGVTLAHEIRARGIPFAVASDNTRDPFHAYGDLDMHEVYRESVRLLHLDHPHGDWIGSATRTPADMMGLQERGRIAVGAPADLILFEGRSWNELLSRPESRRVVLCAGQPSAAALPAYCELDHLFR